MLAEKPKRPVRILIVEDSEFDAKIIVTTLKQGGYAPVFQRVETPVDLQEALRVSTWDIIISDYNMPNFTALDALEIVQGSRLDVPFIIVSGGIGEATAVAAMKAGAHDYVMKGNQARLCPVVERELREAADRQARRNAEVALRESELRYRLLWETATDAVLLIDTHGKIEFANSAVWEVFGYKSEELVGQPIQLLQPDSLRETHQRAFENYQATGHHTADWRALETLAKRKDGLEIPVEMGIGKMSLHSKTWFVGFVRDISQRKDTERTLRENAEQFRAAREIQERLFPKSAPKINGFDIAGMSVPAAAAGGDYFDFIPMLNNRVGVVVADVSGHGIGPALLMAETRAYLRILARNRENIGEILTRANMMLTEDLSPEQFITLLLACIDPATKTLIHANAGHPAGVLIGASGELRAELKRTGVPLGMHSKTTYQPATEIKLLPGDTLLIFTDGVEETMTPSGEFFERERVVQHLIQNRHLPAREIVDSLYTQVRTFAQAEPRSDDFTAIVVKVLE